jgi:hypothetical protein
MRHRSEVQKVWTIASLRTFLSDSKHDSSQALSFAPKAFGIMGVLRSGWD